MKIIGLVVMLEKDMPENPCARTQWVVDRMKAAGITKQVTKSWRRRGKFIALAGPVTARDEESATQVRQAS